MDTNSSTAALLPDKEKPQQASKAESAASLPRPRSPERRQTTEPVFVVEDSFYRSRTPPRPVHWSIAWSDLMMTMFILFLVLYAHFRAHHEILSHNQPHRVADENLPVQSTSSPSELVFHPISQNITEKVADDLDTIAPPGLKQVGADILIRNRLEEDRIPPEPDSALTSAPEQPPASQAEHSLSAITNQTPLLQTEEKVHSELITSIYDLSKHTLTTENLERFASVELVPDKTMRIVLTGDLLFASGQAELTPDAIKSLQKLSAVIKKTPYMINVIGHTDDRSVNTLRYPSNWELSLARASRVARFLIESTNLAAEQFSVSGYSSFRPVVPNTTEENRRINRRVEIILSKEPPQAKATTSNTLE
ncbi:OmpA family protein [Desulfobulbus oligotrophicus]|uniref:OmpA family protein n=1 Tax=Desulfobulbus oligotrophicus TaxID=1909699 RepID=A0A7T5VFE2_9BACT|nr:OmpA family protein [Desulfobulbus oligotrophicus]QQG66897.1 OmpA family protein [Desulfobulbus oligotrophicus]